MKILFFDQSSILCNALQEVFRDIQEIQVLNCDIKNLPKVDYVVAPGNSYAIMTGGLDLAIRDILGFGVQETLQNYILQTFPFGIPVGSYIVADGQDGPFNLLYTPTMRIPTEIRPQDVAFVMSVVMEFALKNPDKTIAIPGLGSGVGNVQPHFAAAAMRAGYDTGLMMRKCGYV